MLNIQVYLSLLPIVVGVAIASLTELSFNLTGLLFAVMVRSQFEAYIGHSSSQYGAMRAWTVNEWLGVTWPWWEKLTYTHEVVLTSADTKFP